MIVEHVFVTTKPENEAAAHAAELLAAIGFIPRQQPEAWVDFTRPGAQRPAAVNEFEYRVRGSFDRQRVGIAITVAGVRARSFAISNSVDGPKPSPETAALMKCIAAAIELRLAAGRSNDEALQEVRKLDSALAAQAARRRWWRGFAIWAAVVFILLTTGFVIWVANH